MLRLLLKSLLVSLGLSSAEFNPRDYVKHNATCAAVNRVDGLERQVALNLQYVDINPTADKVLLMVHGWPSLWSSWKYQIEEFRSEYRLIIPDLRGYGSSAYPGEIKTSGTLPDLVNDMSCILQHAKVDKAVCVGHDWGTQVCYETARTRTDLITAVVGLVIPYMPYVGDFVPVAALAGILPHLGYQVYFNNHTETAIEELSKDVRRSLRATLRTTTSPPPESFLLSTTSYLDAWSNVTEIPAIPFFSADEEDYWVEQYSIQGFNNNVYWYQDPNRYESWKEAQKQTEQVIKQPVLSILPISDPVANWVKAADLLGSAKVLRNFTQKTLHGQHWVHLEFPGEVNAMIKDFLAGLPAHVQNMTTTTHTNDSANPFDNNVLSDQEVFHV